MAITIEVTEEEQLALDTVTADVKAHFTNALQSRAKQASSGKVSFTSKYPSLSSSRSGCNLQ